MNKKIIQTGDGSHTIYIDDIKETYHSNNGAINEAVHVFIKNGLLKIPFGEAVQKNEINILEIGFGTGLNAFISLLHSNTDSLKINYTAIEKYPVALEYIEKLNYPKLLEADKKLFLKLHSSEWNKTIEISENFKLHKIKTDLKTYVYNSDFKTDIVYFDAFSPKIQEEMWTIDIFKNIYEIMNKDAIFCTYSSAGIVKRNLRSAGFKVKRLAGPKGKFHILNAFKI